MAINISVIISLYFMSNIVMPFQNPSEGIDNALVLLEDGLVDVPIELRVSSFIDFVRLARQVYSELGALGVDSAIDHEASHQVAAKVLGATVNFFGVAFHPSTPDASWGDGIGLQTFVNLRLPERTPDINKAAIFGFPAIPSSSDTEMVESCGYDLDTLAEKARYLNSLGDSYIPVPISRTPGATDIEAALYFQNV